MIFLSAFFVRNSPYCLEKVSGFIFEFREINLLGGKWFLGQSEQKSVMECCIATRKQEARISIYTMVHSKRTRTLCKWLYVALIMYYILLAFRIITFQFLCAKICDVILIYSFGKVRRIILAIFEITNSTTNGLVLIRISENEMIFSL